MGEANEEAWDLWQFVQGQWRMSFAGPVALDYSVMFHVAHALEIEVDRPLLLKLKAMEREALKRMAKPETKGDLSQRRKGRKGKS